MDDIYFNEFHKTESEALEKGLEEQSKHPCTFEQTVQQIKEIKEASKMSAETKKHGNITKKN